MNIFSYLFFQESSTSSSTETPIIPENHIDREKVTNTLESRLDSRKRLTITSLQEMGIHKSVIVEKAEQIDKISIGNKLENFLSDQRPLPEDLVEIKKGIYFISIF